MSLRRKLLCVVPVEWVDIARSGIKKDVRTGFDQPLVMRHMTLVIPGGVGEKGVFRGELGDEHYFVAESEAFVQRRESQDEVGHVAVGCA